MKEPRIDISCDYCWRETDGERVPADTSDVMTLPGMKPRTLDLCERHTKEVNALRELVRDKGAKPSDAELVAARRLIPKGAPVRVVLDNKPNVKPSPTTPRVNADGRAERDNNAACPVCEAIVHRTNVRGHIFHKHNPHRLPEMQQPNECPDCGEAHERMAQHRQRSHGYDLIADLLDYYNAPAGVK